MMASYSNNESVMVEGQIAYFRKGGSIANVGTLNLSDALTARNYIESYIGPNSILHGTDLATTADYISTESSMQNYMGDDWVEDPNERTIITNANKIATMLSSGKTKIQQLADDIENAFLRDYILLNYIQSSGTQYINTTVKDTACYMTEISFLPISSAEAWQVYLSSQQDNFTLGARNTELKGSYFCHRGNEIFQVSGNVSTTTANTFSVKNNICKMNNTQYSNVNTSQSVGTSGTNIYICANSALGRKSAVRIYYVKLYDASGTLLRDFIPATRKSDNKIGLLDLKNKSFYLNAGTGTFIAGPEVNQE